MDPMETNPFLANNMKMITEYVTSLIEEEEREKEASAGKKRRARVNRDRQSGAEKLFHDYFAPNPVYTDSQFRQRYRMQRPLFLRILESLQSHDVYFTQRADALNQMGLSPLQKCTASLRMLAYGSPADSVDEYVRIGKSTVMECLDHFVRGIIEVFGAHYLRRPDSSDLRRLLDVAEQRGFPGMIGSIDCMHWEWQNCPVAWKGQFTRGDHGKPTVMLEAVASKDLWIWHAFFGMPGCNNDINVLNNSPVFDNILQGQAPRVQFTVNGTTYDKGYYLADGIYPEWPVFVKTVPLPQGEKRKLFARLQESYRKDVERAFGVLRGRFGILRYRARVMDKNFLSNIMYACIILHNMIVEDEREGCCDLTFESSSTVEELPTTQALPPDFETYLSRNTQIHHRQMHHQLKHDLIEHVWQRFGANE